MATMTFAAQKTYPRLPNLPYPPVHPFPIRGRAADRLFSWKGCGACEGRGEEPRLHPSDAGGATRKEKTGLTSRRSITAFSFPGVPSRTRGYYGPRA